MNMCTRKRGRGSFLLEVFLFLETERFCANFGNPHCFIGRQKVNFRQCMQDIKANKKEVSALNKKMKIGQ